MRQGRSLQVAHSLERTVHNLLCDVLEEEKLLKRFSSKHHLIGVPSLVCIHDTLDVTSNNEHLW
jgi:hypothetical protein